jgi:hypothetical protein
MNAYRFDAQVTLGFLVNQVSRIEREVYAIQYPDIRYPGLIPVDTTGPEWVKSVTYFSSDRVGRAQWFAGRAQDVPHADVVRTKAETGVKMAAIGYEYDDEELAQAQMLGQPLQADKAAAAQRAAEEFIDRVALFGDASAGYTGLINNASVTSGTAPATGTGSTTTFSTKTADQVLADVNGTLTGMWTGSLYVEMADTLLLPYSTIVALSQRRVTDQDASLTIMDWIQQKNIFTLETGRALTIRGLRGLETAGSGGTARMVAYRRDPGVLKMYMPMPFRFLPVWRSGPMTYEVPGIFRLGGVDVKRPTAMRYLDGI